ncbi:MAG: hypothetical protein MR308_05260 [Lachnospiraceae bacterium]|nr:hypothetical protein [Lachnospiraceae bacterium]
MKTRKYYEQLFNKYPDVVTLSQFRNMLGGIGDGTARKLMRENRVKHYRSGPDAWISSSWIPLSSGSRAGQTRDTRIRGVYCKKYLDYIYVNAMGELVKPNFITQHFEIVLKNHGLKKPFPRSPQ